MTEAFVFTDTDRTKSRWVAKAYHDFIKETGRSRTTLRGLFYYALQRKASDYPLCGGFVGEIRITRPYHESDGAKLSKWMSKARTLRFIPADAILEEVPGENVFLPDEKYKNFLKPYSLDAKGMVELDALEVYYPGGIAGFLEDALSKDPDGFNSENPKVL